MEDYSPILWILVVLGGLIYSGASQARKNGRKTARKHDHGEAWPAWDTPETSEQPTAEEVEEKYFTYENEEAPTQSAPLPSDTFGRTWEQRHIAEKRPEPANAAKRQHVLTTERFATENIDTSEFHEAPTFETPLDNPFDESDTTTKSSEVPAEQPDRTPTQTGEEFDLRRAVIYSEILKPKFDK